MSEMIERVSKAKWARRQEVARNAGVALADWDDELEGLREEVRAETRRGIAAMREPTEDMKRAGWHVLREKNDFQTRLGNSLVGTETPVYSAMIDEALK